MTIYDQHPEQDNPCPKGESTMGHHFPHQLGFYSYMRHLWHLLWTESANDYHSIKYNICVEGASAMVYIAYNNFVIATVKCFPATIDRHTLPRIRLATFDDDIVCQEIAVQFEMWDSLKARCTQT